MKISGLARKNQNKALLKENLHIAPRIFEKTTKNIEIQMVRFHEVIIEKSCEIMR